MQLYSRTTFKLPGGLAQNCRVASIFVSQSNRSSLHDKEMLFSTGYYITNMLRVESKKMIVIGVLAELCKYRTPRNSICAIGTSQHRDFAGDRM
jgi:hypothetical protein